MRVRICEHGSGKADDKARAAAGRRRDRDATTLRLDVFLRYREAKTGTGERTARAAADAAAKDLFALRSFDPWPRVVDRYFQLVCLAHAVDADGSAFGRIADGVHQHVGHDLSDTDRIADESCASPEFRRAPENGK